MFHLEWLHSLQYPSIVEILPHDCTIHSFSASVHLESALFGLKVSMVQQGEGRWVSVVLLVMSIPWWACWCHTRERVSSSSSVHGSGATPYQGTGGTWARAGGGRCSLQTAGLGGSLSWGRAWVKGELGPQAGMEQFKAIKCASFFSH